MHFALLFSINISCKYINTSCIFVNIIYIYKNTTCIYRKCKDENKFMAPQKIKVIATRHISVEGTRATCLHPDSTHCA